MPNSEGGGVLPGLIPYPEERLTAPEIPEYTGLTVLGGEIAVP